MKSVPLLFLATILAVSAGNIQAGEPTPVGKWRLNIHKLDDPPQKRDQYELELSLDGDKLTGTFTSLLVKDKPKKPVVDGTFKEGKVRFGHTVRTSPPGNSDVDFFFEGVVEADTMHGEYNTGLFGQKTIKKWGAIRIPVDNE